MDSDTRVLIAAQLTAGMLASGQYKLAHTPEAAAEFAVNLFRHVRGELVQNSTSIRPGDNK